MRIQHNLSALNTFRQLSTNNTGSAKSLEKLSSGYKINRAGDDAAGLAISEKMRAQINGLNRASANAQDGVSLIQAAEGALQETHSILQRMRELGVQAASDVNELEDRSSIQDELNQLKTEIDRIANTTEFNKKTLLDGSLQQGSYATKMLSGQAVVAGAYIDQSFANEKWVMNEEPVTGIYTVAIKDEEEGRAEIDTYTYDLTGMLEDESISVTINIAETDRAGSQVMEDTPVFSYTATGDAAVDNAAFINGLKEALQSLVTDYEITTSGNSITFTAKGIGSGYSTVDLAVEGGDSASNLGGDLVQASEAQDATVTISYTNPSGELEEFTVSTEPGENQFINGVFSDLEQSGLVFQMADLTKSGSSILNVVSGKNLTLQTGANTGKHQTIDVSIRSLSAASLGIDNLSVSTYVSSQAAVAGVENAIQIVSTQRAELGAVQNRLEHTVANLDTVAENLQNAESRVRDVDMAKEMMNFTKYNILMQASQAMMAQANSQPQGVLQLLR